MSALPSQNPTPHESEWATCPSCLGAGEHVCGSPGEPGHDHHFIRDTSIHWCDRCNGKGRIRTYTTVEALLEDLDDHR